MARKLAAAVGAMALGGVVAFALRLLYPVANPGLHGFAKDVGLEEATIIVTAIWMISALVMGAVVRRLFGWMTARLRRTAPATAAALIICLIVAGPAAHAQDTETQVFEYVVYVLASDEYAAWQSAGYDGEPPHLTFIEQGVVAEVTFPAGPVRGTGLLRDVGTLLSGSVWTIDLDGSFLGIDDGEIGGSISGEFDYTDEHWFQHDLESPAVCWAAVDETAEDCPGCADALSATCAEDQAEFDALWGPVDSSPPVGEVTGNFRGTMADDGWAEASMTIVRPGHADGPFVVPEMRIDGYLVFVPSDPSGVVAAIDHVLGDPISDSTTTTTLAATDPAEEPSESGDDGDLLSLIDPLEAPPPDEPHSSSPDEFDCGDWACDEPPLGVESGLYASAALGALLAHLAATPRTRRWDSDLYADDHIVEGRIEGSTTITTDEYLRPETTPSGQIGSWDSIDEFLDASGRPESLPPGWVDLTDEWHGTRPEDASGADDESSSEDT